ncbi:Hypothetical_protein [Hexamita inflata]|uniref:Hypothetical_protein n=1 Tax=Hexamita inflata TaxID=28002 RepID=A0AA86UHC2_9EUKA|nr:Hypothetical protein HINF_LOCUS45855 [Hexamita inflata]
MQTSFQLLHLLLQAFLLVNFFSYECPHQLPLTFIAFITSLILQIFISLLFGVKVLLMFCSASFLVVSVVFAVQKGAFYFNILSVVLSVNVFAIINTGLKMIEVKVIIYLMVCVVLHFVLTAAKYAPNGYLVLFAALNLILSALVKDQFRIQHFKGRKEHVKRLIDKKVGNGEENEIHTQEEIKLEYKYSRKILLRPKDIVNAMRYNYNNNVKTKQTPYFALLDFLQAAQLAIGCILMLQTNELQIIGLLIPLHIFLWIYLIENRIQLTLRQAILLAQIIQFFGLLLIFSNFQSSFSQNLGLSLLINGYVFYLGYSVLLRYRRQLSGEYLVTSFVKIDLQLVYISLVLLCQFVLFDYLRVYKYQLFLVSVISFILSLLINQVLLVHSGDMRRLLISR